MDATEVATTQLPPSPVPTSTVTPGPDLLLLVIPGQTTQAYDEVRSVLESYAQGSGLELREVAADDLNAELEPGVRLVVALQADEGLESLARSNPDVGFLLSGSIASELENGLVVSGVENIHDRIGFLAGYTAALITPDYRVGGVALAGEGPERAALEGFVNGVVFYCGLCRAAYPPFNNYPQSITIPSVEPAAVRSAVQQLKDLGVSTIYLSPDLSSEAVFTELSGTGVRYIGSVTPSVVDGFTWTATISSDTAAGVERALEKWSGGESGQVIEAQLVIVDSDETAITPGKLEHLQRVIQDLGSGRIDSGVDPETGEAR